MGFLEMFVEHQKKNKLRKSQFHVLKASMAAAALIANADGDACAQESKRVQQVMRTLEDLKLFDGRHGLEIFQNHVKALKKDPEKGAEEVMEAIGEIKDDPELATMVAMICKTISEGDGVVDDEEKANLDRICSLIDIDPETVKSVTINVYE